MAEFVLTDAFVSVNAVDLSDHVKSVTVKYSAELQDATVMGNAGRRKLAGLKDWSIDVEFDQDFASAKVDATLYSLVGVETALKVRASKTGAISATNPEFQGNGMLESYSPVAGSIGDVLRTSVTFQGSDGVALIRDVTP
jgi:hypothetical protein